MAATAIDQKAVEAFKKIKPENRKDAEWNAIHDANVIARANEILKDPQRVEKARIAAVVILEEEKGVNEGLKKLIDDAKI